MLIKEQIKIKKEKADLIIEEEEAEKDGEAHKEVRGDIDHREAVVLEDTDLRENKENKIF